MKHKCQERFCLITLMISLLLMSFSSFLIHAEENENINNAGDFYIEGGTAWSFDSENKKLIINESGTYIITGDNKESDEQIEIAENFSGTITIKNINAKRFYVNSSSKLTLLLDGKNILREGLRFDNPRDDAYLIIDSNTNGSLVARGNKQESGIGAGAWQNGGNIEIKGGNITAIGGDRGAGIGNGYAYYSSVKNIKISGGTVTTIGGYTAHGIGCGYLGDVSNIVITGGSVKASSQRGSSAFGTTPTDENGNIVYLTLIDNLEEVDAGVVVDDNLIYKRSGGHDDDNKFYLYLSGGNHSLKIKDVSYSLIWKEDEHKFLHQYNKYIDYNLNISGIDIDSSCAYDTVNDTHYILKDGAYKVSQNVDEVNERIVVTKGVIGTLTLDNVNIKSGSETISLEENVKLNIKFDGDNYIETSGRAAAISTSFESSSLTFDSDIDGILNVTSTNGVAIGSMFNTYNITFNSGTINAKGSEYGESDIGIGLDVASGIYCAKNIVINGGTINCLKTALGSSYGGNRWFSKNCEIIINGGTVTAPVIGGTTWNRIDDTYDVKSSTKVIINGGSVKGKIQAPDLSDENINDAVYDKDGNRVYLAKIDNLANIDKVNVDDNLEFVREGNHPNDNAYYLYLTGKDHVIYVNSELFCKANWSEEKKKFMFSDIKPKLSLKSKNSTLINVNELDNQDIYGEAEYSINNKESWQASNIFEGLDADKEYTIYARYKGKGDYLQSDAARIAVKTLKSGKNLIKNKIPLNLVGTYGQKLVDINLPDGWTWTNKDMSLIVGNNKYLARFDIKKYKDEYDFLNVIEDDIVSCNLEEYYIEANLNIDVSKAKSTLSITNDMNKTYDKEKVEEPIIEKTGSSNSPTFSWFIKENENWNKLDNIPTNAGEYKVIVIVDGDDNYDGVTTQKTFEIYKALPDIPLLETYNIKQNEALSSIDLPSGFIWKDKTQKAIVLGRQAFKAIYTPIDSINYQSVELDVYVNVVENGKNNEQTSVVVIEDKTDIRKNETNVSSITTDKETEIKNTIEDKTDIEKKITSNKEESHQIEEVSKEKDLNISLLIGLVMALSFTLIAIIVLIKYRDNKHIKNNQ